MHRTPRAQYCYDTYRLWSLWDNTAVGSLSAYNLVKRRLKSSQLLQERGESLWNSFKKGVEQCPSEVKGPLETMQAKVHSLVGLIHASLMVSLEATTLWKSYRGPVIGKIECLPHQSKSVV